MFGGSWLGGFGTLHTRRSPSKVWVASMSVLCLDEDPCHASPVILDGALVVVNVCNIVNDGCNVAIRIEPLRYLDELALHLRILPDITYPMAKVLQSAEGASAVMGSKIVRAEMCSDVEGSNNIMLP